MYINAAIVHCDSVHCSLCKCSNVHHQWQWRQTSAAGANNVLPHVDTDTLYYNSDSCYTYVCIRLFRPPQLSGGPFRIAWISIKLQIYFHSYIHENKQFGVTFGLTSSCWKLVFGFPMMTSHWTRNNLDPAFRIQWNLKPSVVFHAAVQIGCILHCVKHFNVKTGNVG